MEYALADFGAARFEAPDDGVTTPVTVTNQATGTWRTATATVPDAGLARRRNDRTGFRTASAGPVTIGQVTIQLSGPGALPVDLRDR